MTLSTQIKAVAKNAMDELLARADARPIPKVGDLVEGTVISASKNEVLLDIDGITAGVVRGKEIYDESDLYTDVQAGAKVSATVLELENENGQMELSFRYAGHQKAWESLDQLMKSAEIIEAKIIDANKGGLMVKVGNVIGFLPVSQLNIEHYPRVEGGDKTRILFALKKFVGTFFKVKVIDVNENEEKLIVSEKAAWEEKQQKTLSNFKVGDTVEGKITGVVDFGAFIEFTDGTETLEGLIHISELAWQRIDDPKTIVKVGDVVKAEIISIENSKISLSMKKLQADPWKNVEKKYAVGQKVKGKILKINPFGAFVELDPEIHGLIHISEFNEEKKTTDLTENESYDFYIISLEPREHRLGLSFKPLKKKEEVVEKKEEKIAEPVEPEETKA
ncbi:MAG: S1 RNA-binding domain-containing protein [Candidatus Komeilibacteria bacterium]|nr:S1 RNA-binding domain-containing protein [Candidatus Komeilibacteria bacterium]